MRSARGEDSSSSRSFTDMAFFDDIALGRHAPGTSSIHGLDPRLKLILFPLLVIASFSASTFLRSGILLLLAVILVALSRIELRCCWRGLFAFRWLFLFMILLHALFSPGRTLFGTDWISLDGLYGGAQAVLRLALAITFSSMLTLTTPPADLASALVALLSPLRRFGLPADAVSRQIFLVFHFIPVVREEGAALMASSPLLKREACRTSLLDRGREVARFLDTLLKRLLEQADSLASEIAGGGDFYGKRTPLPPFWPLAGIDLWVLFSLSGILLIAVFL